MNREKQEIIKELDNFITGLYAVEVGRRPNIVDGEGNYTLCAFCGSGEIKLRMKKFRFCEKDWKLLNLFIELKEYA